MSSLYLTVFTFLVIFDYKTVNSLIEFDLSFDSLRHYAL